MPAACQNYSSRNYSSEFGASVSIQHLPSVKRNRGPDSLTFVVELTT